MTRITTNLLWRVTWRRAGAPKNSPREVRDVLAPSKGAAWLQVLLAHPDCCDPQFTLARGVPK